MLWFAGMPALPALLGRGKHLAGPSGFWVGHSSERFTVELMSDREPGLRARLPGIQSAGAEMGADERTSSKRAEQTHSFSAPADFHDDGLESSIEQFHQFAKTFSADSYSDFLNSAEVFPGHGVMEGDGSGSRGSSSVGLLGSAAFLAPAAG